MFGFIYLAKYIHFWHFWISAFSPITWKWKKLLWAVLIGTTEDDRRYSPQENCCQWGLDYPGWWAYFLLKCCSWFFLNIISFSISVRITCIVLLILETDISKPGQIKPNLSECLHTTKDKKICIFVIWVNQLLKWTISLPRYFMVCTLPLCQTLSEQWKGLWEFIVEFIVASATPSTPTPPTNSPAYLLHSSACSQPVGVGFVCSHCLF